MSTPSFTGHECWVFAAQRLDELCGHHPRLLETALRPGERLSWLVYSPLREADAVPFGVRGGSGSHALAISDEHIFVSRDPHRRGLVPSVTTIRRADLAAIEVGEALTLGWIVFRFVERGELSSETICFASSGIEHFRTAARTVRGTTHTAPITGAASGVPEAWTNAPAYLRGQVSPLLTDREPVRNAAHVTDAWTADRRRPVCVGPESLMLVTDRALFVARSEPPQSPGALAFAVNVTCIERHTIRDVAVVPGERGGAGDGVAIGMTLAGSRHVIPLPLGCHAGGLVLCLADALHGTLSGAGADVRRTLDGEVDHHDEIPSRVTP